MRGGFLMHDDMIIKLFFERSETAISELKNKYQNLIFSIANNFLDNKEDSEECVSSTYLKLWNSIPPQKPKCLRAYFSKIVRNLAIDKIKQDNRKKRKSDNIFSELDECIPSHDNTELSSDHTITEVLNSFLGNLDPLVANLFVSRYFYGLSVKEIAKKYNLSETNTSTKILRARQKLREKFEKEGVLI